MNKKVWSFILLCLTVISFLLMIALCISTERSMIEIKDSESSPEYFLGELMVRLTIQVGFLFYSFGISAVGFFSSLINTKIAPNPIIKRISAVFMFIYSITAIFIIGSALYFVINIS